jgi:peptide/nickel transport system permease protein
MRASAYGRYIGRRLLSMIGVLLALVAIVLVLRSLTPVDPGRVALGADASKQAVAAYDHRLGLDKSLPVQYVDYLGQVIQGNFGYSIRTQRPISDDLSTFLPATVELAFVAFAFALALGLLIGIASALPWRGARPTRFVATVGACAPPFLLAFLLLIWFGVDLGWFPISGQTQYTQVPTSPTGMLIIDSLIAGDWSVFVDAVHHVVLPALVVAIIPAVAMGRMLRSSLLEVLRENYIKTARTKGLSERRVILGHALRNAVGPSLSIAGLQAGLMLAGIVIVEQIFGWPGIGTYLGEAIPANDFPAIAAVTLILGAAYVVLNLLVDIAQALANPRLVLES